MDVSKNEDVRGEMHNPNLARVIDNNDSQQRIMIRDDYVSSQSDSHILLVGKSETRSPYSKLDDLNNIFGSKKAENNKFPRLMLQMVGISLDQGKPNFPDHIAGSHKLFLVPDESFVFLHYVEDP